MIKVIIKKKEVEDLVASPINLIVLVFKKAKSLLSSFIPS